VFSSTFGVIDYHAFAFECISQFEFKELRWLPVPQRVYFKTATLTYNTVHTKEPGYLLELIQFYEAVCSLHSCSQGLLSRARTCTLTETHAQAAIDVHNRAKELVHTTFGEVSSFILAYLLINL